MEELTTSNQRLMAKYYPNIVVSTNKIAEKMIEMEVEVKVSEAIELAKINLLK